MTKLDYKEKEGGNCHRPKKLQKHLTSFKIYSIMNTERQKKEGIKNER